MSAARKKWLLAGTMLLAVGILGSVATIFALGTLQGDAAVLDDIDKHFQTYGVAEPSTPSPEVEVATSNEPSHPPASGSATPELKSKNSKSNKGKQPQRRRRGRLSPNAAPESITASSRWPQIRQVAPMTYEISPTLATAARKSPQQFITGVKAVIAQKGDAPIGFRLFGIHPDSVLYAVGLRNGDILMAVNGFELKSLDQALRAAGVAKFANKFRIDILRNGTKHALYCRVA